MQHQGRYMHLSPVHAHVPNPDSLGIDQNVIKTATNIVTKSVSVIISTVGSNNYAFAKIKVSNWMTCVKIISPHS